MVGRWIRGTVVVCLLLVGVAAVAAGPATPPDVVVVESPGLAPEGIEWDASAGRFLLSSLANGSVVAVTDDGAVETVAADDALVSSVGIEVDAEGGRLLVANSDAGMFGDPQATARISLGIFDLETGKRIGVVDLLPADAEPGRHFANDVAVDADGNAYVTDSLAPVIYKVDADGKASVLLEDERFGGPQIGLNGIVYDPGGFLLAAVSGDGSLYKIPLAAPGQVTAVKLDAPVFVDGMVLRPSGDVVAVDGRDAKVVVLRSDDNWASAEHVGEATVTAGTTTVALRGDDVYALSAHLGESPAPKAYEIVRVELPELRAPAEGHKSDATAEADDPAEERVVAPVPGAYAPDFVLKDGDGKAVSLKDYAGQVVLLNFWATWCPYCLGERPTLQAGFEEYGERGLAVLTVDIGDAADSVAEVVKGNGLTFPVLLDEARQVSQAYAIRAVPTTFVIDREGKIIDQHIGPLSAEQIAAYVTALE